MDSERSNQLILDIKNKISELRGVDLQTLKREGRDFDFADVFPNIQKVYDSINELEKADDWLTSLPLNQKQNLFNNLNSFYETIKQIRDFTPSQISNPQEHRNNLAITITNLYHSAYPILIEPMYVESLSRKIKPSNVSNLSKTAEENLQKIKNALTESESLLESAKKVTAQTGLTEYAGIFETQAEKNIITARIWICISIAVFLGLVWYLFVESQETLNLIKQSLTKNAKDFNSTTLLALSLAKLFLASVGYYGLYQAIKNYNVNMHLHTLNKFRANVLKTFESFVKSTDDPHIRDVVLVKASESIFDAGETGYIKETSKDGSEPLVQVLEQIKK